VPLAVGARVSCLALYGPSRGARGGRGRSAGRRGRWSPALWAGIHPAATSHPRRTSRLPPPHIPRSRRRTHRPRSRGACVVAAAAVVVAAGAAGRGERENRRGEALRVVEVFVPIACATPSTAILRHAFGAIPYPKRPIFTQGVLPEIQLIKPPFRDDTSASRVRLLTPCTAGRVAGSGEGAASRRGGNAPPLQSHR
jgi:hypothetical protein